MKTLVSALTVALLSDVPAQAAVQAIGPRTTAVQPSISHVAFHHFHHHVVFVGGWGWWGYPYYYNGYPGGYYGESYEKLGKQWGKELKKGKVTIDQFVSYLQLDLLKSSDSARSHFQVGFLKGYGKNGLTLFTRALVEAKEKLPAPAPTLPPPPANPPPPPPSAGHPLSAPQYE